MYVCVVDLPKKLFRIYKQSRLFLAGIYVVVFVGLCWRANRHVGQTDLFSYCRCFVDIYQKEIFSFPGVLKQIKK